MKTTKEIQQELDFKAQRVDYWETFNTVPEREEIIDRNRNLWGFSVNDFYEYDVDRYGMVNLKRLEVS